MNVHIRHAGKSYDIKLDSDLPPAVFKEAIYQKTGVPPDRMKVMVKGGVLKVCAVAFVVLLGTKKFQDDSSWHKIGPKEVRHLFEHAVFSWLTCSRGKLSQ